MLRNRYYTGVEPAVASFDERNHCVDEGWATWQPRPMFRFRFQCWLGRHAWPLWTPHDGLSSNNTHRCTRCHAFLGWFIDGQHRYGSLNRYFADLK
jgi:hypothetical protein